MTDLPYTVASVRRVERLTEIAVRMHEGQVDKQGRPYSEHILAVTAMVSDEAKPVALFHDAVEDGLAEWDDLSDLTRDERMAVWWLTRMDDEGYAVYIDQLRRADTSGADLAREVKVADLRHNLGRLTPELESLRPRYERALATLGAKA